LTTTLSRAIRSAPLASVMATMAGNTSGVIPTANATANRNESNQPLLSIALARKTKTVRRRMTRTSRLLNRRMLRSKSLSGAPPSSSRALRPNSVARPVAVTMPTPKPPTTAVPR
jgi:hypothetical protein